jgi:hypothetical protein
VSLRRSRGAIQSRDEVETTVGESRDDDVVGSVQECPQLDVVSVLHGLVHILSARLAGSGVTVNALASALIEQTAMLEGAAGLNIPTPPVGRLGQPEEIADIAVAILRNGT